LGAVMMGGSRGKRDGTVLKTGELKNDRDLEHASNRSSDRPRRKRPNKSIQPLRESVNELFITRASSGADSQANLNSLTLLSFAGKGNRTVTVIPLLAPSLVASMVPLLATTNALAIQNPNPRPDVT
jgi:hypothetical protein